MALPEKDKITNDTAAPHSADTENKRSKDLGEYLHLDITEEMTPEPDTHSAVRRTRKKFWRRMRLGRKILVSRTSAFFRDTKKMVILWIAILSLIVTGKFLGWDQEIVGGVVVIVGLIFSAFSWLGAMILSGIALIPFIGAPLVTILSSSLLWIINGLGYFVSIVAIKAGHGKTVLNYRLMVLVFLTGLATGYVLAKLI